jgi:hypothetical protein
VAVLAAALSACGAGSSSAPVVLVIQDAGMPDARDLVTPGVLGVELGLEGAGLGIRVVDANDLDVAAEVSDGQVVVAVIAPFTRPRDEDVEELGDEGVAVVSLSDLVEPAATSGTTVRALVAPVTRQADTVRAAAPPGAICAAGERSPWSEAFTDALRPVTDLSGPPAAAAAAAAENACATVVWTGAAEDAATFAALLRRTVPDATLILGSPARTSRFAAEPPLWLTPLAECACVDLSTSAEPEEQAFLHAYASANGLDPGPFAAEGYDAGRLIASAARGGTTRQAIAAELAGRARYAGLAGTYVWGSDGDLRDPPVRMYERVGLRWLERPPSRVAPEATRE